MSTTPSAGIGTRVAHYRRLSGLSAQQLSDAIGGMLSRGVIANIETGRKTDISVDQLLALAWALDVPPVVLALPADQPDRFVNIVTGGRLRSSIRSSHLVRWFNADASAVPGGGAGGAARALSRSLLRSLVEYDQARTDVALSRKRVSEDPAFQDRLNSDLARLDLIEKDLRDLGADLTDFQIDE